MTYSIDLRWRALILYEYYGWEEDLIKKYLGCSPRSLRRWVKQFREYGHVMDVKRKIKNRWPQEVIDFVYEYTNDYPHFYLEEIQDAIQHKFPGLKNTSLSTVCRVITHDLQLTRKDISKRAYEARLEDLKHFEKEVNEWYSYLSQIVFMDEVAKSAKDIQRKKVRSFRGEERKARTMFGKGKRVSVLAAIDYQGFFAACGTTGTFSRKEFHLAMIKDILPYLNPYPQPRSIPVMDNARIHGYEKIFEECNNRGIVLLTLPPYSPHLNPIETAFGLLKSWLKRNVNTSTQIGYQTWQLNPLQVLHYALNLCTKDNSFGYASYMHSGYLPDSFTCGVENMNQNLDSENENENGNGGIGSDIDDMEEEAEDMIEVDINNDDEQLFGEEN